MQKFVRVNKTNSFQTVSLVQTISLPIESNLIVPSCRPPRSKQSAWNSRASSLQIMQVRWPADDVFSLPLSLVRYTFSVPCYLSFCHALRLGWSGEQPSFCRPIVLARVAATCALLLYAFISVFIHFVRIVSSLSSPKVLSWCFSTSSSSTHRVRYYAPPLTTPESWKNRVTAASKQIAACVQFVLWYSAMLVRRGTAYATSLKVREFCQLSWLRFERSISTFLQFTGVRHWSGFLKVNDRFASAICDSFGRLSFRRSPSGWGRDYNRYSLSISLYSLLFLITIETTT